MMLQGTNETNSLSNIYFLLVDQSKELLLPLSLPQESPLVQTVLTMKSPNKACANTFPGCSRDVARRRDLQLLVWFKVIGLPAATLPRSYGFSLLP